MSALAAREQGAEVIVLEAAPEELRGGNSRFTGGMVRMAYNSVDDLAEIFDDLTEEEKANADFGSYTVEEFFDELIEIQQEKIAKKYGFKITDHSLYLYGVCKNCQKD